MPIPENTSPMMTGQGPFGSVEMGGMFSMVKVRRDQAPDDYSDPGWYEHPPGTVAYEWTGSLPAAPRARAGQPGRSGGNGSMPLAHRPTSPIEVRARSPKGGSHHG